MRTLPVWLACASLAWATAAPAQVAGRYQVSAMGAWTQWDESSGLEDAVAGGIDARYFLTGNLGAGFYFQASRPNTDGTFFPLVRLDFGDTVLVYTVAQQVGSFDLGVQAFYRVVIGSRLAVVGFGGGGIYAFSVDPQQADFPRRPGTFDRFFYEPEYTFGGSLDIALGQNAGFRVEVRDLVYADFDRDRFNLSDPLFREENLPHPRLELPEKKDTIHNLRYTVGFTFVPGR